MQLEGEYMTVTIKPSDIYTSPDAHKRCQEALQTSVHKAVAFRFPAIGEYFIATSYVIQKAAFAAGGPRIITEPRTPPPDPTLVAVWE